MMDLKYFLFITLIFIFMAVDCWKSNVKKKKSVLTLLVEMERVRVFSLEVTMERG